MSEEYDVLADNEVVGCPHCGMFVPKGRTTKEELESHIKYCKFRKKKK